MTPVTGLTRRAFSAFGGAECEVITVDGTPTEVDEVVAEVIAFERRLSRFDPASELCALNSSAGLPFEASPLLRALLVAALDAFALSDGLVNAAVLDALAAAGYDRAIIDVRAHPCRATSFDTVPIAVAPLPDVLDIGPRFVRLAPGHRVDLGGVAKGWLADRLAERFDDVVVNLGGDLRARGTGPEGAGWPVALCDGGTVSVYDAGVATSGPSARCWPGGHHLVDPRTGRPAATDVRALSAVARTAADAEVLAKAAAILGAGPGTRWLRDHGISWSAVTT